VNVAKQSAEIMVDCFVMFAMADETMYRRLYREANGRIQLVYKKSNCRNLENLDESPKNQYTFKSAVHESDVAFLKKNLQFGLLLLSVMLILQSISVPTVQARHGTLVPGQVYSRG